MAVEVNDVHSRLNPTRVAEVRAVGSLEELRQAVRERRGAGLAIAGGRHAMGGQQFLTDGVLLDLRPLDQVFGFDEERGFLRVGAGAQWPAIIAAIRERSARWGIRQKQTGADDLTLEAQGKERPDESLMITELYVPPERLPAFMAAARRVLRESGVEDIYGTIRSIRAEATTFLAWARQDFACIIFNLRTLHGEEGVARSRRAAGGLIDAAAAEGGSFFLTYHHWATREQVERCHPRFEAFLAKKLDYDPDEVFQSDWYRHHRRLFQS